MQASRGLAGPHGHLRILSNTCKDLWLWLVFRLVSASVDFTSGMQAFSYKSKKTSLDTFQPALCLHCCKVCGQSICSRFILAWLSIEVSTISSSVWPMRRRGEAIVANSACELVFVKPESLEVKNSPGCLVETSPYCNHICCVMRDWLGDLLWRLDLGISFWHGMACVILVAWSECLQMRDSFTS